MAGQALKYVRMNSCPSFVRSNQLAYSAIALATSSLETCRPRHGESVQWRTCYRCVLTRVIRDRLRYVQCGIFAAHVVCAHLAFHNDARDRRLETRGHFRFLKPIEHELRC